MTPITGPNGVVVRLPDAVAQSLIGDGSKGYALADEPQSAPKRTPRKTPTK